MNDLNLIPKKNNIRIKEQEGKYVIFNLETSGFHMIEKDAFDLLEKVNGTLTIEQLAEHFAKEKNLNKDELAKDFVAFFKGLSVRKIIELASNENSDADLNKE